MPHLRVAKIIEKELSERTPCDVPGCGGELEGNYMTVNLSLIVGHIRNLEGASSHGGLFVLENSWGKGPCCDNAGQG